MIYFDNAATTLIKPPEVSKSVAWAIDNLGNAGRSFYDSAMDAAREIYSARAELAALTGAEDPLNVAFTSSATESLNLVIGGLIKHSDTVLTTAAEHNSVLRPLYLSGCKLSVACLDERGVLCLDTVKSLITPETRFIAASHGSNVTGNVTDVRRLHTLCKEHNITLILDVSQTIGHIPVSTDMGDVLCFTGHKGLFGPQGTGGIITSGNALPFEIVKTGGAGVNSFDMFQHKTMPDIFETGTQNSHGICGLKSGVDFIRRIGLNTIHEKETRLSKLFYEGVRELNGIRLYGDFTGSDRLPVISFSIDGRLSSDIVACLWYTHGIACRAGSHCAPLIHKHFGTADSGLVRFSFSWFNTDDEIFTAIRALRDICAAE